MTEEGIVPVKLEELKQMACGKCNSWFAWLKNMVEEPSYCPWCGFRFHERKDEDDCIE